MSWDRPVLIWSLLVIACLSSPAFGIELNGRIDLETRIFRSEAKDPDAPDHVNASISTEVEAVHTLAGGGNLVFTPFWRWDPNDSHRTHGDIRKLKWEQTFGPTSVRIGLDKVFWGVVESYHLVDIINQTDILESQDYEEKFGQPMVNLAYAFGDHTVEIFYLPYFRQRQYPGHGGRFRPLLPVDTDLATFEASREEAQPDASLRWFSTLGDVDVGCAYFYGTQREPELQPVPGQRVLAPYYPRIQQVSLDAQWTIESWLLKIEYLHRYDNGDPYHAVIPGVEHTVYGLCGSATDLGVLVEYLFDDRGKRANSTFDNDLFLGLRLVLNNTGDVECVAGPIVDLDTQASVFRFEMNGRVSEDWRLSVNTYLYAHHRPGEAYYALDKDDFVEVLFKRYF